MGKEGRANLAAAIHIQQPTLMPSTALFLLVAIYHLVNLVVHRREGENTLESVGEGRGGVITSLVSFVLHVTAAENNLRGGDGDGVVAKMIDGTTDAVVSNIMIANPTLVKLTDINEHLLQSKDGEDWNVNGDWDQRYSLIDVIQSDTIADILHMTAKE
jgi:hypothetical protein